MNLQIFLTTFSVVTLLNLASALESDGASSTVAQPLAPVNQISRFQLSDKLSYLGLAGLTQNTPVLHSGEFQQQDRTIITQVPRAMGKQMVWVEMSNYWIEPITPPSGRGDLLVVPMTEGMTRDEVVAYFDRDAVNRRFQSALERSGQLETGSTSKA